MRVKIFDVAFGDWQDYLLAKLSVESSIPRGEIDKFLLRGYYDNLVHLRETSQL